MKKYLLLFALVFSSLIFPQTVTITETQVKYTVCNYYGASPDGIKSNLVEIRDSIFLSYFLLSKF